jgi:hypothetical protein
MGTRYIDPIEHAWRHCNPHARLPSALERRAAPFWLYSSHGQLAANLTPRPGDRWLHWAPGTLSR